MFKRLKKLSLIKFVIVFLTLIFIFCFGWFTYRYFFPSVQTEFALFVDNAYDSIDISDSFFIRKESILTAQSEGELSYLVDNGEKVANGENVAAFYRDKRSIAKREQLVKLDSQIEKLKQLSTVSDTMAANPIAIDKQIFQDVKNMMIDMTNKDLKKYRRDISDFLYLMSERQIVTHQITDFSEKINELKKEESKIKLFDSEICKYVKTETPGYFVKKVDGYESLVDYENVGNFFLSDFDKIPTKVEENNANVIGKIVSDQNWYIAARVKSDDAIKFKLGSELELLVPSIFSKKISTIVHSVNQRDKMHDAVVIFKCDTLNEDFISSRRGELKVIFSQYSGIKIPKCALHEKNVSTVVEDENGKHEVCKTLKGVYTVNARRLEFKEIVPLCTDSRYVICKQNPDTQELFNGETVKIYDRVVTKGRNLYEGKNI